MNGSEDEATARTVFDFFLFIWLTDLENEGIGRRDEKIDESGLSALTATACRAAHVQCRPMEITRPEFIIECFVEMNDRNDQIG